MKPEVARGEVELFIIGWVIGNMHLSELASNGAIVFNDNSGVVVETWRSALKQGCHNHDIQFLCQFSEFFC